MNLIWAYLFTIMALIAKIFVDVKLGVYRKNRNFYIIVIVALLFFTFVLYKNNKF